MAVLERVATLVRANLNDLLDKAEDPEKVLRQLLIDMNAQLMQVKVQVATAMGDEKKLRRLWEDNQGRSRQWQHKAELAVEARDDNLARHALARRNSYAELAAGFELQYDSQAAQVAMLREALEQLQAKIQTAEAKKELLIARSRQAKAKMRIQETMAGVNTAPAMSAFRRLEARVDEQELRASALEELDTDTVEARFQELERADQLDQQLRELKERGRAATGRTVDDGHSLQERETRGASNGGAGH